jgi:hypothetical protein
VIDALAACESDLHQTYLNRTSSLVDAAASA